MKLKDILTLAGTILAPVAAGAVAGPGGAALVASAVGAAGATKKVGKRVQKITGNPVHKLAAPTAAVATPVALAPFLPAEWITGVCDTLTRICDNPGAVTGALAVIWHVFVKGARDTISPGKANL